MRDLKLKICGMKRNTAEVAALRPDYLGFIFWEPSSRFFNGELPNISADINKVGVFVDASVEEILAKVVQYDLQAVQLHGKESPKFCEQLRRKAKELNTKLSQTSQRAEVIDAGSTHSGNQLGTLSNDTVGQAGKTANAKTNLNIIKVFSIKDNFDFRVLEPFEQACDYYLFDTKGKLPGGNGYTFDWNVLANYSSTKPYFLSGGIGLEDADAIIAFMKQPEAEYCFGIDVNSKFEVEAGRKNIKNLNIFKQKLLRNSQIKH